MKVRLVIVLLLIACHTAIAQDCNCESKFLFVKAQMEHNYSGFKDKTSGKDSVRYARYANEYLSLIKKIHKPKYCLALMGEWLSFFKDGHVQLYDDNINGADDTASLNTRIRSAEKITLPKATLAQLAATKDPVEGIYVNDDSTYTIAIVKSKNEYRDLAGVIVSSRTDVWQSGQVKLELRKMTGNLYGAIAYAGDHEYTYRTYKLDKEGFNNGQWVRVGKKPRTGAGNEQATILAKKAGDKTMYIKLGSFDGQYANIVDSIIRANDMLLKTTPYLIIDLRGNGGGADFVYTPVMPYLYTGPVVNVGVDVLATKDNIRSWRDIMRQYTNLPADEKKEILELTDSMAQHLGEFVSSNNDNTFTQDKVYPFPQKVIILVDKNCASSAEQFLLAAKQSGKVSLWGQPTEGVLDYANMRQAASSCKDVLLFYATTRSRRLNTGKGIDNIGIKPDKLLADGTDWVQQAVEFLENK